MPPSRWCRSPRPGLRTGWGPPTPAEAAWLRATGFRAGAGELALVPGPGGGLARALAGTGEGAGLWSLAGLPSKLPEGSYALRRRRPGDAWSTPPRLGASGWGDSAAILRSDPSKPAQAGGPGKALPLPWIWPRRLAMPREARAEIHPWHLARRDRAGCRDSASNHPARRRYIGYLAGTGGKCDCPKTTQIARQGNSGATRDAGYDRRRPSLRAGKLFPEMSPQRSAGRPSRCARPAFDRADGELIILQARARHPRVGGSALGEAASRVSTPAQALAPQDPRTACLL